MAWIDGRKTRIEESEAGAVLSRKLARQPDNRFFFQALVLALQNLHYRLFQTAGGEAREGASGILFAAARFGPFEGRDEVSLGGQGLLFCCRQLVVRVGGDRLGEVDRRRR